MIGIIGGVGPYAGLHLHKCILDQTMANYDQDHLPVIHINCASEVPDRTEFLLGHNPENPAVPISRQIDTLYNAGARVIGLPCNTAHADSIYDILHNHVQNMQGLIMINMIDELFREMARLGETKTGLLATLGSYRNGLFNAYGKKYNIEVVLPEEDIQARVHDTIYNSRDGLKSTGMMNMRINSLYQSIFESYRKKHIHSAILGCTEISMAFPSLNSTAFRTFKTIDILAGSLIREYYYSKQRNLFNLNEL